MSKTAISWLFFVAICTTLGAQSKAYTTMLQTLLSHTVPEISVTQAVKQAQSTGTYFMDARETKEFNVSHIKGAISVGYDHFDLKNWSKIPKNAPIIVYCSVGYRSEKVAEKLIKAGYTNVKNLYGGIFEWVNQNNTIVDNQGKPTQKVHAFDKNWGIWLQKGIKVYG